MRFSKVAKYDNDSFDSTRVIIVSTVSSSLKGQRQLRDENEAAQWKLNCR